jgi:hypothetical protein
MGWKVASALLKHLLGEIVAAATNFTNGWMELYFNGY